MRDTPLFGPGGNSEDFYAAGNKSTVQAPGWVRSMGLTAYEYEAGQGIRATESVLRAIGQAGREAGIAMSLHAPYFISLSGVNPETRLKSISIISESLQAADWVGADIIVVHTGSAGKMTRDEAMYLASDTLERTLRDVGYPHIRIGLETMGKRNQLGTLDEVIELCQSDPRLVPVVDFGHLNARECGGVFTDVDSYRFVFDKIGTALGDAVARNLHCHFSKIEWTNAGEKRHLTLDDTIYGPPFEPLMEAICREGVTPTVISESAGTQSRDSLAMKTYYDTIRG